MENEPETSNSITETSLRDSRKIMQIQNAIFAKDHHADLNNDIAVRCITALTLFSFENPGFDDSIPSINDRPIHIDIYRTDKDIEKLGGNVNTVEAFEYCLEDAPMYGIIRTIEKNTEKPKYLLYEYIAERQGYVYEPRGAVLSLALFEEFIKASIPLSPAKHIEKLFSEILRGKWTNIKFPYPLLTSATNALLPETVTILCGSAGTTKSLFLLNCLIHFFQQGLKLSVFELEGDVKFHLRRAVAILEENSQITNNDWIQDNPDKLEAILKRNETFMNEFGERMTGYSKKFVNMKDLSDWIVREAKSGSRIIAIDPVTAALKEGKAWELDQRFMQHAIQVATNYHCSIILVTHPRTGQAKDRDIDSLSGGKIFREAAQTILWLWATKDLKPLPVKGIHGNVSNIEVNRIMEVLKTRNSWGMGHSIGYMFDGNTFHFEERGMMVK